MHRFILSILLCAVSATSEADDKIVIKYSEPLARNVIVEKVELTLKREQTGAEPVVISEYDFNKGDSADSLYDSVSMYMTATWPGNAATHPRRFIEVSADMGRLREGFDFALEEKKLVSALSEVKARGGLGRFPKLIVEHNLLYKEFNIIAARQKGTLPSGDIYSTPIIYWLYKAGDRWKFADRYAESGVTGYVNGLLSGRYSIEDENKVVIRRKSVVYTPLDETDFPTFTLNN